MATRSPLAAPFGLPAAQEARPQPAYQRPSYGTLFGCNNREFYLLTAKE